MSSSRRVVAPHSFPGKGKSRGRLRQPMWRPARPCFLLTILCRSCSSADLIHEFLQRMSCWECIAFLIYIECRYHGHTAGLCPSKLAAAAKSSGERQPKANPRKADDASKGRRSQKTEYRSGPFSSIIEPGLHLFKAACDVWLMSWVVSMCLGRSPSDVVAGH